MSTDPDFVARLTTSHDRHWPALFAWVNALAGRGAHVHLVGRYGESCPTSRCPR